MIGNLFIIYQNEYQGYIKFSNGYCRQWGVVKEKFQNKVVTLMFPFKDTNYNAHATHFGVRQVTTDTLAVIISPLTTNTILINKPLENGSWVSWSVEGFYK